MKRLLVLSLLLWGVTLSPIDKYAAVRNRVMELIRTSPSIVRFFEKGNGVFEFESADGEKWLWRFFHVRSQGGLKPRKIISIDLRQIDTTGYTERVDVLTSIPIGISFVPPIGSDLLNMGRCELTGQYFVKGIGDNVYLYRKQQSSYSFIPSFVFHQRFFQFGSVDIDMNGLREIVGDSSGSVLVLENSGMDSIDLKLKYVWDGINATAVVPRIMDLDHDGYSEIITQQSGNNFLGTKIIKYMDKTHTLESVFQYQFPGYPDFRGYWAVGDFDKDDHMEFVTVNMEGVVYFLEHVAGNVYAVSFTDTTRSINAYFHTEGNDLDGDGRPECFIGSDEMNGRQTIAVYETLGDNRFEVSAWIELYPLGTFVWPWLWTGDVTGDGRDDIVFSCVNTIMILEATTDDEYRVIWYKRYPSNISQRLYDIDRDGKMEILLSTVDNGRRYTEILSYHSLTSVDSNPSLDRNQISTVFPTPANDVVYIGHFPKCTGILHVRVFTIDGNLIFSGQFACERGRRLLIPINTTQLRNGLYFVSKRDSDHTEINKLVVLH